MREVGGKWLKAIGKGSRFCVTSFPSHVFFYLLYFVYGLFCIDISVKYYRIGFAAFVVGPWNVGLVVKKWVGSYYI